MNPKIALSSSLSKLEIDLFIGRLFFFCAAIDEFISYLLTPLTDDIVIFIYLIT
jgi:hypothetical protein